MYRNGKEKLAVRYVKETLAGSDLYIKKWFSWKGSSIANEFQNFINKFKKYSKRDYKQEIKNRKKIFDDELKIEEGKYDKEKAAKEKAAKKAAKEKAGTEKAATKKINYAWNKKEPKGCSDFIKGSDGKAIKAGSLKEAKKLCSKNKKCVGVYDWKCDGWGYNLCKSTKEVTPWKYPSCWYEKTEESSRKEKVAKEKAAAKKAAKKAAEEKAAAEKAAKKAAAEKAAAEKAAAENRLLKKKLLKKSC